MARLNTDNPDTMPITDATYGKPKRRGPERDADGKFVKKRAENPLWKALPQDQLDSLAAAFGGRVRRAAAMRRHQQ
jgi:hypothetical protein